MYPNLELVVQIKDDIVIHGKGKAHNDRLKLFLARLEKHGLTLRREKCKLGVPEVLWFGHIYDKDRMSVDPEKVRIIKDWPRPKDKAGVKSFLQTVQFCKVFMSPMGDRAHVDVTLPLRRLTAKSV